MEQPTTPTAREIERACVCQALRRVARQVSRRYEAALRPVGLKAGQFSILAALLRDEAVPLGRLAEALGMDRTTLTRDLRPLERRGLVASAAGEGDRRVRALALTGEGRALMGRAVPLWERAQEGTRERLGSQGWGELRERLDGLA